MTLLLTPTVASLRHTCAIIMMSNQLLDVTHLWGVPYVTSVTDSERLMSNIWEKWLFHGCRKCFRSWDKWGQNPVLHFYFRLVYRRWIHLMVSMESNHWKVVSRIKLPPNLEFVFLKLILWWQRGVFVAFQQWHGTSTSLFSALRCKAEKCGNNGI